MIWFVVGYIAYIKKLKYGRATLLSYVIVEGLFYVLTFLSGAPIAQVRNHSDIIKLVFVVAYISGLTAVYYAYQLIRRMHEKRS